MFSIGRTYKFTEHGINVARGNDNVFGWECLLITPLEQIEPGMYKCRVTKTDNPRVEIQEIPYMENIFELIKYNQTIIHKKVNLHV